MTGFDHLDDGTPAAAWRTSIDALPRAIDVRPGGHVVVLAAHPDDETLGAGGLLVDAALAGVRTTVIVATFGESSHPRSRTHSRDDLADRRRDEVVEAVRRLDPDATLILLGLPDSGLERASNDLLAALHTHAAGCTVLATPWRGDGHPDHEACARAALAFAAGTAIEVWQYPIWGWQWGRPDADGPLRGPGWIARPISAAARIAKRAAVEAHRSQHEQLSPAVGDEPILRTTMLEHFYGDREVFLTDPGDLPPEYFDRLYATTDNPWGLEGRFYEERKRALLLAALPRARFRRAFEPGCATGLLTVELAGRCDEVLALDVNATAVERARGRVVGRPGVTVTRGGLPADLPGGRFDLVVLSEVGYYLADLDGLAAAMRGLLEPDGVLVACHWRHPAPGYPSSADAVHTALGNGLHVLAAHVEEDFRLDVWSPDATSVARAERLVE